MTPKPQVNKTLTFSGDDTGWQYFYSDPHIGLNGTSSCSMTVSVFWSPDQVNPFKVKDYTSIASGSTVERIVLPKGGGYLKAEVTSYSTGNVDIVMQTQ